MSTITSFSYSSSSSSDDGDYQPPFSTCGNRSSSSCSDSSDSTTSFDNDDNKDIPNNTAPVSSDLGEDEDIDDQDLQTESHVSEFGIALAEFTKTTTIPTICNGPDIHTTIDKLIRSLMYDIQCAKQVIADYDRLKAHTKTDNWAIRIQVMRSRTNIGVKMEKLRDLTWKLMVWNAGHNDQYSALYDTFGDDIKEEGEERDEGQESTVANTEGTGEGKTDTETTENETVGHKLEKISELKIEGEVV